MYVPKPFAVDDPAALAAFMAAHDFAILVTTENGAPFATHIPLLHAPGEGPHGTIYGHVARANPHWQGFDGTVEALAIFQGSHAYISPAWYPAAEAVPTWNYSVVHAYGRPAILDDPADVRALLGRLVAKNEAGRPSPWSMDGLSERYFDGMIRGIVAFRMPVERIEGKAKLSQNHPAANRDGAIAGLRETGRPEDRAVAEMMEKAGRAPHSD